MFTGIIRSRGTVAAVKELQRGVRLSLQIDDDDPIERGESIAVNGVCLTAISGGGSRFEADVSSETLSRTTLRSLSEGDHVNIERALRLGDRLGGHLVSGHVDGVGSLRSIERQDDFALYRWSYPDEFADLLVEKGSIAVDGVSLTVVDPDGSSFGAALIPETLARTNLGRSATGHMVNLEFDMMAKFARNLLAPYAREKRQS